VPPPLCSTLVWNIYLSPVVSYVRFFVFPLHLTLPLSPLSLCLPLPHPYSLYGTANYLPLLSSQTIRNQPNQTSPSSKSSKAKATIYYPHTSKANSTSNRGICTWSNKNYNTVFFETFENLSQQDDAKEARGLGQSY
jgi:hypothetical protein